ncbi:hypothetical protein RhiJN_22323 [Ceratobasidium sp. AG-Ba]|nr:hypothetical protein RhiJN_22323 [Ceratobasidium sp. AG-Ba]
MRPIFLIQASAHMRPIAHISQLFAKELCEFNSLETFELSLEGFRLSDSSNEEVFQSFGTIGNLKTWQSYCGSLQCVILYGTKLE